MNHQPTYQSWHSMIRRCTWPLHKDYENYGGRGIKIDPRWLVYRNFLADMGERPEGTTLERKDVNWHYFLNNCRWATFQEQNFNRRPMKTSRTGVVGVCRTTKGFRAYGKLAGVTTELYRGPDFLEACARRKSWEIHHVRT